MSIDRDAFNAVIHEYMSGADRDADSGTIADAVIAYLAEHDKPVVIEAIQWTGSNPYAVREFTGVHVYPSGADHVVFTTQKGPLLAELYVAANAAWVSIEVGEWVIRDSRGFYPCKPDIFEAMYGSAHQQQRADEFDRWLAEHDAEVARQQAERDIEIAKSLVPLVVPLTARSETKRHIAHAVRAQFEKENTHE